MFRARFRRPASWLLVAGMTLSSTAVEAQAPSPEPLALAVVAPIKGCAALRSVDVSRAVGAATVIDAATMAQSPTATPYCSVKVSVDNYAHFELHLPTTAWTQRLLFGGGPGAQTAQGMSLDQFATVSWDDLGHRNDADIFAHDDQARINAGYRGMHLQVLTAKALITRYYGRGPRFAYYNACSNPGLEGMKEAQRFPNDFDGIGAGCPPLNISVNNGLFYAWNVLTNTGPDGKAIITADTLPILHKAVLDQCDAADGVKDGIVSDPFACHPTFGRVECKAGNTKACLTAAQIHVAEDLYRGPHDSAGNKLTPIGVLPGSELAWTATIVPGTGRFGGSEEARAQTSSALRSQYSYPALPAAWQVGDVKFDRATFDATTRLHGLFDATNPDLSAYAKAGHKLILWQALGDTNVLPAQAILYYTAVEKQLGAKTTNGFMRFYTLPGVYHCGGGDGPVITDFLQPLMAWVERGVAPGAIMAAHRPQPARGPSQGAGAMNGQGAAAPAAPDLTRPVYPYPQTATYSGSGDVRQAANFGPGPARPAPASLSNWLGADFYTPASTKWCTATANGLSCTTTRPGDAAKEGQL